MADVVDLDALSVKWFTVRKVIDGVPHEYRLNDRVSTGVTIWAPSIAPLLQRLEDQREGGAAREIREIQAELEERILYFCAEIFRNSYPDMTDDWVREHLSHDDRWEICTRFFTSHGDDSASASPSGDQTPSGMNGTKPKAVRHSPTPRLTEGIGTAEVARRVRLPEEEALAGLAD